MAIPGDTLDEMMAQHLDGTPYAPSMTALGDGNYQFENKKVTARVLNGKLVIKIGGGFMLIDEFLKTYDKSGADKTDRFSVSGPTNAGRMSPKRGSFTGVASPKRFRS